MRFRYLDPGRPRAGWSTPTATRSSKRWPATAAVGMPSGRWSTASCRSTATAPIPRCSTAPSDSRAERIRLGYGVRLHAQALQPSGAHGRVGGGARSDLRWPGGPGHGAIGHPGRAAEGSARPGRKPSDVAGGGRTWSGAGPTTSTSSRGSTGRCPCAGCSQAAPAAPSAALGGHHQRRGPCPDGGPRAGSVFLRRRPPAGRGQAEDRPLPRRRRHLLDAHRRLRAQPGRHLRHGRLHADRDEAVANARESFSGTRRRVPPRSPPSPR